MNLWQRVINWRYENSPRTEPTRGVSDEKLNEALQSLQIEQSHLRLVLNGSHAVDAMLDGALKWQ